jgi:hypothetical protein
MAGHAASPLSVTSVALVRSLAVSSTLLLLLIQAVLLGGCAGQKLAYGDIVARVDASGTAPVAVAAHDQRKLITSGQESPTFVGRMRSQHHIAGVNTASGKPLGDDLACLSTDWGSPLTRRILRRRGWPRDHLITSQQEPPSWLFSCARSRCLPWLTSNQSARWRRERHIRSIGARPISLRAGDVPDSRPRPRR